MKFTFKQQPIVRMWILKNLKAKKMLRIKTCHKWIIWSSWKLISMLISHFQVVLTDSYSQYIHSIPFSSSLHICIKWCEWGFASLHLPLCMCKYHVGWSQCPKLMHKTYKILCWLEVNHTKGGFHTSDFLFASDWKWSHSTRVLT